MKDRRESSPESKIKDEGLSEAESESMQILRWCEAERSSIGVAKTGK